MLAQATQRLKAAIGNTTIMNIDDQGNVDGPDAKPEIVMGGESKKELMVLVDMIEGDTCWKVAQDIRAMIAVSVSQTGKIGQAEQQWIDCVKALADKFEKRAVALKLTLDELS